MASTVLYDSACNFCKVVLDALLSWDGRRGALRPLPIQSPEGQALLAELPEEARLTSFHLVTPGEPLRSGGPALAALLGLLPGGRPLGAVLGAAPRPTAAGYDWVARNRVALSRYVPSRLKTRADGRLRSRLRAEQP